jgi:hypothetical protein
MIFKLIGPLIGLFNVVVGKLIPWLRERSLIKRERTAERTEIKAKALEAEVEVKERHAENRRNLPRDDADRLDRLRRLERQSDDPGSGSG